MDASCDTVGVILLRDRRDMLVEPFYSEVISGMESVLATREMHVLMQVVSSRDEELASYERWAQSRSVAGVVLTDLGPRDTRPALLAEYGFPGVILGDPEDGMGMAIVRTDDFTAMSDAVHQLAELGHRVIGRVSGPNRLQHTRSRTAAFENVTSRLGIGGMLLEGDYSAASGEHATRELLASAQRPTAIIYDNDVMAVAGLGVALVAGIDIPGGLSILAWDDSTLCRIAQPPLSAMSHDVFDVGQLAARALLGVIDGDPPGVVTTSQPTFVARSSTGRYSAVPAVSAVPAGSAV
ncbi:MAG: LacI family transcriptional regulator [Acidobacteria bacterium]|nr:LacI family transcriptional regulator [Acidobacteriota bacterium]